MEYIKDLLVTINLKLVNSEALYSISAYSSHLMVSLSLSKNGDFYTKSNNDKPFNKGKGRNKIKRIKNKQH